MTTLTLTLDNETKRFERDDGPVAVHAGETVSLILRGLGLTAADANGTNIPEGSTTDPEGTDLSAAYPYLRVRLVHPVFGDLAMYPWPGSPCEWEAETAPGTGLKCQIDLDTEQLFSVVRNGLGGEITIYVETPWPESVPTVYGTYPLRVEDWPEATGEVRVFPTTGRYVNAAGALKTMPALEAGATLNQTISAVNGILAALKTLAQRNGEDGE